MQVRIPWVMAASATMFSKGTKDIYSRIRRQPDWTYISLLFDGKYPIAASLVNRRLSFREYSRSSLRRRVRIRMEGEAVTSPTALLDRLLHEPSCFDRFKRDHPTAKVVRLARNYRSSGTIVAAAVHRIAATQDQPARLQLVEESDDVAWIQAQRIGEGLLAGRSAFTEKLQRDEVTWA